MGERNPRYISESTVRIGKFIYNYISPVAIAGGLLVGGAMSIREGKRIVAEEFVKPASIVATRDGLEDMPDWTPDAFQIGIAAGGILEMGIGIAMRVKFREYKDMK